MINFLECALDLLFPPICGFCGKTNDMYICNDCKRIVKELAVNKIIKFNNKSFKKVLYIFKYDDIIREKILEYKFGNKSYLYRTFAEAVLLNKSNIEFIKKYDFLIPVPIHKKRKLQRGFNQSELIARKISQEIKDIKLDCKIIKKQKNIVPQSTLNRKERDKNIKGAYSIVNSKKIIGKNILLLDDIFTTGSTLNECSKLIKMAGAKRVDAIVIAKD